MIAVMASPARVPGAAPVGIGAADSLPARAERRGGHGRWDRRRRGDRVAYFAAMLARTADGWVGRELDFDEVDDLEALVELMRDAGEDDEPVLVLVDEDD